MNKSLRGVGCRAGNERAGNKMNSLGSLGVRRLKWNFAAAFLFLLIVAFIFFSPLHRVWAEEAKDGPAICDPFAQDAGTCGEAPVKGAPERENRDAGDSRDDKKTDAQSQAPRLRFYWGIGCPHCEEAKPFIDGLEANSKGRFLIERIEIRQDPKGRELFEAELARLGIQAPGIPMFVMENQYSVGFKLNASEAQIQHMVDAVLGGKGNLVDTEINSIDLPIVGSVNPRTISLPALTMLIGLVDGINPCAMYVLVAMMGILLHVKSRSRLFLFGGTFVLMSGLVYFLFMTAWLNIFMLTGLSGAVTIGLGILLIGMGLINLKELFWFKKGVSLMVPDKAKPGLFRRMREIASAASLPAALLGIGVLAFVVNLIELGCTLGLPAVYTRLLSLRSDISGFGRYAYLALYNIAYIIPLAAIVLAYAITLHRISLSERGAKILKGVSGTLLVSFGLLFVLAPDLLR